MHKCTKYKGRASAEEGDNERKAAGSVWAANLPGERVCIAQKEGAEHDHPAKRDQGRKDAYKS